MRRALIILAVFTAAAIVGVVLWKTTGSTTAGYVVGVAGAAAGIAALLISPPSGRTSQGVRSKLTLRNVKNSNVVGADLTGDAEADARIKARDVDGSDVTGVRTRPKH